MDALRPDIESEGNRKTTRQVIWLLGITQLIAIGSVFYSFALLAPGVSGEFDIALPLLFAMLSVGIALSGFVSPWIGRLVDRVGGARVMTAGSALTAGAMLLLAASPNVYVFGAGTILLQTVSVAALFGVAAPTVTQFVGGGAPRAITLLTVIMGLSATAFLPLIGLLDAQFGWRGCYVGLALIHLFIALPCHASLLRLPRVAPPRPGTGVTEAPEGAIRPADRRFAFWAVAISLSLSSSVAMGIAFQLVPILLGTGLGAVAFAVAAILGPAQVVIRIAQATVLRNVGPLPLAIATSICLGLSIGILLLGAPPLIAAIVFVSVYGLAQGLAAIISSILPLDLFGRQGYGEMLGRMALMRVLFNAPAPFILTTLWETFGLNTALLAFLLIGLASAVPLLLVRQRLRSYAAP